MQQAFMKNGSNLHYILYFNTIVFPLLEAVPENVIIYVCINIAIHKFYIINPKFAL